MRLPTPEGPTERGEHRDLDYWLWAPADGGPHPAVVILHGAGSRKESHADFGRACAASGWVAVAYDQRGHGESARPMSPGAVGDVSGFANLLAERGDVDARRVCVRGSSMGGHLALHAAAVDRSIAGAIAICPASEDGLREGLRRDRFEMRADVDALDAWLGEHDLRDAIARIAGRPLLLMHARGDDRVPVAWTEELYAHAGEPRRLIVVPGGTHRSVQHDGELQGASLRWMQRQLEGGSG